MQQTRPPSGGSAVFSFKLQNIDNLDIQLDAASLLDEVSTLLTRHHRHAILHGRKASGGAQKGLVAAGTQGVLAREGKRPKIRGNRGKLTKTLAFADGITRSAISQTLRQTKGQKAKGQVTVVAKCTIGPNALHAGFVQRELTGLKMKQDGDTFRAHVSEPVEYFFVDGDSARIIDKAVDRWLQNLLSGKPAQWTKTELQADGMSGPARQTDHSIAGPVRQGS